MNKKILLTIMAGAVFLFACEESNLEKMQKLSQASGDRKAAMGSHKLAYNAYKEKNFVKAESLWMSAAKEDPSWETSFYNLACLASKANNKDDAIGYLKLTLQRDGSMKRIRQIEKDSDLKSMSKSKEFKDLITKYKALRQKSHNAIVKKFSKFYDQQCLFTKVKQGDGILNLSGFTYKINGTYSGGAYLHSENGKWKLEDDTLILVGTFADYNDQDHPGGIKGETIHKITNLKINKSGELTGVHKLGDSVILNCD